MKIHAYDLQKGDVITSLHLDPAEPFVVDHVNYNEDGNLVYAEGYTQETGEEYTFYWGDSKALEIIRGAVEGEK